MNNLEKIKAAYTTCNGFMSFVFHLGYQGFSLPLWSRKVFAKTVIHKAWFSGFYGRGIMKVFDRHNDTSELINY